MEISGLLRKSGLDLVTTELTSIRRSYCIKYSRKTSSDGSKPSHIGQISEPSNGSIEWREGSTVCIGWNTWSIVGTESREGEHEHKVFFLVALERK